MNRIAEYLDPLPAEDTRSSWVVIEEKSTPVEGCVRMLQEMRIVPPPKLSGNHQVRVAVISGIWGPLLKSLGLAHSAVVTMLLWYIHDTCSWEHLMDFLLWHLETGLVPVPADTDVARKYHA